MAARSVLFRRTVALVGVTGAAVGIAVAAAPPTSAAPYCTTTWTGGSGDWSSAANWSEGTLPDADDHVCVLRPAGGAAPVVTLAASATVKGVTLVGATLRLPAAATVLTTTEFVVERGLATGRGTVLAGQYGATRFRDARLDGIALFSDGSMIFRGGLAFSGGARVVQSYLTAYTVFDGDVAVTDVDGDPANHLTLWSHGTEVAAGTTVAIDVPFRAQNSTFSVAGTLRLPHLDGLGDDGVLAAVGDDYSRFATWNTGRIQLPRTVTRVGPGIVLEGTVALVAPGGGDALADLAGVGGTIDLQRPLTLPQPLEVTGGLRTTATLRVPALAVRGTGSVFAYGPSLPTASIISPLVRVEPGASFTASSLTGRLESAGATAMSGARWGAVALTGTAVSTLSLLYGATINRSAKLAGQARVFLPRDRDLPPDGGAVVLLTATGGVTGQFAGVTTYPAVRGTVTLEYTPTQVIAVFHAPGTA